MAIVDFDQIEIIRGERVLVSIPAGPINDPSAGDRTDLHDDLWGYFIFGQRVRMDYSEGNTYRSVGEFTITGSFTRDKDAPLTDYPTDEDAFNRLTTKFVALQNLFENASNAVAPADYSKWAGPDDPRTVVLPLPLFDKNKQRVYAHPVSLEILAGSWPNKVAYKVVLEEAKAPEVKCLVNGQIIDNAVIHITLPKPILYRKRLLGCAGELIQVENYEVMQVQVEGQLPQPRIGTKLLSAEAQALKESLLQPLVDIGIVRHTPTGVESETLFANYDVEDGTGIDLEAYGHALRVVVHSRARQ
jgi:hypothetical protein